MALHNAVVVIDHPIDLYPNPADIDLNIAGGPKPEVSFLIERFMNV
jgi:hypothetical protein